MIFIGLIIGIMIGVLIGFRALLDYLSDKNSITVEDFYYLDTHTWEIIWRFLKI